MATDDIAVLDAASLVGVLGDEGEGSLALRGVGEVGGAGEDLFAAIVHDRPDEDAAGNVEALAIGLEAGDGDGAGGGALEGTRLGELLDRAGPDGVLEYAGESR
jgi:hypothetical protein